MSDDTRILRLECWECYEQHGHSVDDGSQYIPDHCPACNIEWFTGTVKEIADMLQLEPDRPCDFVLPVWPVNWAERLPPDYSPLADPRNYPRGYPLPQSDREA